MSAAAVGRSWPDLRQRAVGLTELMDDPGCDPAALDRTYARFALVNRLVAGWRATYRRRLRPLLRPDVVTTLLDLGCGGGDLARALRRWAEADGLALQVDAVDPDPRAVAFARRTSAAPGVTLRQTSSDRLWAAGERFDVVVSNHLLHHLDEPTLAAVLDDSAALARRLVLHSDLRRSRPAYLAWSALARPAARDSFLLVDGLRSIRRAHTVDELAATAARLAPDVGWHVEPQRPFRLLLTATPDRPRPQPPRPDHPRPGPVDGRRRG